MCCTTRVYTGTGVFQQDRFDCHMANHCSFEKFCTADGFTKNRGMNSGPGISVMFSAIQTPLYKLTLYSITRNVCKLYTCLDHFAMSQFGPGLCKSFKKRACIFQINNYGAYFPLFFIRILMEAQNII